MKKVFKFLFSETVYIIVSLLIGAIYVEQGRYGLAFFTMGVFIALIVRKIIKEEKPNESKGL
jgi:hypothetical protein